MTRWCNASSSSIPQSNSHSTPPGHVFLCSDFFPLAHCLSNDTVHYFSYCFCRINCGLYKICSMDMIHIHSVIILSAAWLPLALLVPIVCINLSFLCVCVYRGTHICVKNVPIMIQCITFIFAEFDRILSLHLPNSMTSPNKRFKKGRVSDARLLYEAPETSFMFG